MTGYLSRREPRVEHRFPRVCPKCGEAFVVIRRDVPMHFRLHHKGAIGRAILRLDSSFDREFAYISPVEGAGGARWNVVWLDWPVEIVRMTVEDWVIQWLGPDPREGDRG